MGMPKEKKHVLFAAVPDTAGHGGAPKRTEAVVEAPYAPA
jgi:hypothetical protein